MQPTVNTLPTKALPPEWSRGANHRAPQQHLTGEPSAKERLKKHHPIIRILYLLICTENDRFGRIPKHTQLMYDNSPQPKQLKFFTGNAHGTELFYTLHKEEFRQLLLDFLEDLR